MAKEIIWVASRPNLSVKRDASQLRCFAPLTSNVRHKLKISKLMLVACCLQISAFSAWAENFDITLLRGEWSEGQSAEIACSEKNIRTRLELSSDKKTLEFILNKVVLIENQLSINKFSAKVLETTENSLAIEFSDLGSSPIPKGENDAIFLTFASDGVYTLQPNGIKTPVKVMGYRCN